MQLRLLKPAVASPFDTMLEMLRRNALSSKVSVRFGGMN
jgi:hypothetical protein